MYAEPICGHKLCSVPSDTAITQFTFVVYWGLCLQTIQQKFILTSFTILLYVSSRGYMMRNARHRRHSCSCTTLFTIDFRAVKVFIQVVFKDCVISMMKKRHRGYCSGLLGFYSLHAFHNDPFPVSSGVRQMIYINTTFWYIMWYLIIRFSAHPKPTMSLNLPICMYRLSNHIAKDALKHPFSRFRELRKIMRNEILANPNYN